MKYTDLNKLASICLHNLRNIGVEVDEFYGLPSTADLLAQFDKTDIHPKLDPMKNDFDEAGCIWLLAKKNSDYFACVGARIEKLGSETAIDYWTRTAKRHYPNAGCVSFDHLKKNVARVKGNTAYMGDLFVHPDYSGSATLLTNFLMLMHLTIRSKWDVDIVYAFLRQNDLRNGKQDLYHFPSSLRDYQRWVDPPPGRANSESLLTISNEEFEHYAQTYLDQPERLVLGT